MDTVTPQPSMTDMQPSVPLTPMPPPSPKKNVLLIALLSIIAIGVIALVYIQANKKPEIIRVAEPTPIVIITPTPVKQLTTIASTSAFMVFSEHVASLSAMVNEFSLQDGLLTPPLFDVEISFKEQ